MKPRTLLTGLVVALIVLSSALITRGSPDTFIIENADATSTLNLAASSSLGSLLNSVLPRAVLEFSDDNRIENFIYPALLLNDSTPPREASAPQLTSAGPGQVMIRWETNEFCRGAIEYGTQPGQYNRSMVEPLFVKNHEVTLTGLAVSSTYFYRTICTDPAGNHAAGAERSFSAGATSSSVFLPMTVDR